MANVNRARHYDMVDASNQLPSTRVPSTRPSMPLRNWPLEFGGIRRSAHPTTPNKPAFRPLAVNPSLRQAGDFALRRFARRWHAVLVYSTADSEYIPRRIAGTRTGITMRLSLAPLAAGLICTSGSWVVQAQAVPSRISRTLEDIRQQTRLLAAPGVPPEQRLLLDYGAILTTSYLSLDDSLLDNRGLREFDAVAYARLNLDDAHEFYIRGRSTYQDFNPGDSFADEGDHWHDRLEEAYYRFDLRRNHAATRGELIDNDVQVKIGRQFLTWAGGLTFSNYLDGALVDIDIPPVGAKLLAGVTPRDTVDFDSSRPGFEDHTKRALYGVMLQARIGPHRPFAYFLRQEDHNPDEVLSLGPIQTNFKYDSTYVGIGSEGALNDHLLYRAELVYEGGDGLSRAYVDGAPGQPPRPHAQTLDNIEAFAADLAVDYLWSDIHRPLLGVELIAATGDSDRGDTSRTVNGNKLGTSDRAFNAFGFVGDSLAFEPAVSNLFIVRLRGSIYPRPDSVVFRKMQLGADLFLFNKFDVDAPIGEPSAHNRFLGIEPDISVNWEIMEDVTLALRYGVFFPGDGISANNDIRQFIYFGVSYAF
jgi:hypothetical protein